MYETYLAHYGVKGMKWGVRRYQDYDGKLTKVGKDRIKDERVNRKIQDYINSGKAKVSELSHYTVGSLTTMTTAKGEKYISGLMNGHDFDWQEVTKFGGDLGDGWENPATVIQRGLDKGEMYWQNKSANDRAYHDIGTLSPGEVKRCNPGYGNDGTTQNCAKCSASLELRLRGFDIAAGRQTYPSSVDAQSFWFKDAQRVDYDYDVAEEALSSYGANTSGTLSFKYPGGSGGHAVHWTNDSKGNFSIQDGQNGRLFGSLSDMMNEYGGDIDGSISTFRLDNCEPNWDNLASDSVIRLTSDIVGEDKYHKVKNKFSERVVDTW